MIGEPKTLEDMYFDMLRDVYYAEKARRIGVLVAFLTAASMALGAAAAWWDATMGGRHRDENTDLSTYPLVEANRHGTQLVALDDRHSHSDHHSARIVSLRGRLALP